MLGFRQYTCQFRPSPYGRREKQACCLTTVSQLILLILLVKMRHLCVRLILFLCAQCSAFPAKKLSVENASALTTAINWRPTKNFKARLKIKMTPWKSLKMWQTHIPSEENAPSKTTMKPPQAQKRNMKIFDKLLLMPKNVLTIKMQIFCPKSPNFVTQWKTR